MCHYHAVFDKNFTYKTNFLKIIVYFNVCFSSDIGMPAVFRPPEASSLLGPDSVILDGQACDLIGFGVMLVELYAYFPMSVGGQALEYCNRSVDPYVYTLWQVSYLNISYCESVI